MRQFLTAAVLLLAAAPAFAQTRATTPNPFAQGSASPAPAASIAAPSTPRPAPGASSSANQFSTEAAATSHCPGDAVVWANTRSRAYHLKGTRYYGHTKAGAYMCQKDADAGGMHATQGEKTTAAAGH